MPFLSAFLDEGIDYARREHPKALKNWLSRAEPRHASRMRIKLLDDNRPLEEMLAEADRVVATVKDMFMREHRGLLGPLKRALQDDLGIHFVQGEAVGTLHAALQNTGMPMDEISSLSWEELGPYLREAMIEYGSDMTRLLSELGIVRDLDADAYAARGAAQPLSATTYRDFKSERFYGSVARRVSPGRDSVGVVLTSVLSAVNAARVIVPKVDEGNDVAAFKIRFVILYHAAASLQKFVTEHRTRVRQSQPPFLRPDAAERMEALLAASHVRSVYKKTLRNHLVHYDLKPKVMKRIAPCLVPELPLHGLVEAHTSGQSLAEVAEEVERGLDLVANELRALMPESLTPRGTL